MEEGSSEARKILFKKYEMGRLLGKGTFAKVYLCRHLESGEAVAIKVMNKEEIMAEPGLMEQIMREIEVMHLIRHPNVVELKEVMATKSHIYFVMEYVRGGALFDIVSRGRVPEDLARHYFRQLIAAVDYCHSRDVSHRDLKPDNLLLDEHGNLKVSDFGFSALPEQLRHDGLLHTQCGSPAYVAPEVLSTHGYDGAKADIWSCGVILFVLLAGFLPFQDENMMRMYRKIFKAEYQIPPWVSAEARRFISSLLVADPDKRITIPEIRQLTWFKVAGIRRSLSMMNIGSRVGGSLASLRPRKQYPSLPAAISSDEDENDEEEEKGKETEKKKKEEEEENDEKPRTPRFYNAFDLISSMSASFNLSSLFERRRKVGKVFTSRAAPEHILDRLQRLGRVMGLRVELSKPYEVKMEKREEGRKGRLAVAAEVFEVADGVALVEFSKSSGDTLEYTKFCEDEIRPGLKDIVWTWQGDGLADGEEDAGETYEECNGYHW